MIHLWLNGIPLIFQVEVQVVYLQNWFWDKVIATAVKTHLLKYHILSKQYLLENLETVLFLLCEDEHLKLDNKSARYDLNA